MIISISNHKGGTGKTTTAINLSAALLKKGKRVLLIDLDPQGSLSYSCGVDNHANVADHDLADLLINHPEEVLPIVEMENVHIIPGGLHLYAQERALGQLAEKNGYNLLRNKLEGYEAYYDYVVIDCPPSFNVFTTLALAASDYIVIPLQLDVLSINGLGQVLDFADKVRQRYNPALEVAGILAVLVDERRQLTFEVLEYIRNNYKTTIFNNFIRSNVKAAEAPSFAQSVIEYAPDSRSAKEYIAFTNELLKSMSKDRKKRADARV